MDHRSSVSDIRWPEFVVAPQQQRERVQAAVYPITIRDGGPCFGVTLDQRWVCGGEGERTLFDSMAAVSRFLQLVKVRGVIFGSPRGLADRDRDRAQCFCLFDGGLASCTRCHIGLSAHARVAEELAKQYDHW